jgi:ABC-type spermidine/putrescine transport system permease subunit II
VNRAFFIILTPALLVAAGYIIVLRYIGVTPGYARLIVASILFFGMIYWLSLRSRSKANSRRAESAGTGTAK